MNTAEYNEAMENMECATVDWHLKTCRKHDAFIDTLRAITAPELNEANDDHAQGTQTHQS